LRLTVLTFSRFSASVVLNLFLIYNQKYFYASTINRLMKFLFVLAQLGANMLYVNKREAKCTLRIVRHLLLFLFTTLIENLILCSSAEAGIVLNLFLNFEQNEPRVLIKLFL